MICDKGNGELSSKIYRVSFNNNNNNSPTNDTPNLAHRLLKAFSDLEKRKQKSPRKTVALARAPTLSQNPM